MGVFIDFLDVDLLLDRVKANLTSGKSCSLRLSLRYPVSLSRVGIQVEDDHTLLRAIGVVPAPARSRPISSLSSPPPPPPPPSSLLLFESRLAESDAGAGNYANARREYDIILHLIPTTRQRNRVPQAQPQRTGLPLVRFPLHGSSNSQHQKNQWNTPIFVVAAALHS